MIRMNIKDDKSEINRAAYRFTITMMRTMTVMRTSGQTIAIIIGIGSVPEESNISKYTIIYDCIEFVQHRLFL